MKEEGILYKGMENIFNFLILSLVIQPLIISS